MSMTRRRFTALLSSLALAGCAAPIQRPTTVPTAEPEATLRLSGSGTFMPLAQKLADAYQTAHPAARLSLDSGTNSGGAIKGVLQGQLDIAVTNRPLAEAEVKERLVYRAVARDAVAFAANLANAPAGISSDQVREIYAGKVTDWGQVGAPAGPIMVLDRDEDESMRKLVLLPVLGGQPVKARTIVLTKAKELIDTLLNTPNAIGYSSLALLRMRELGTVRILALDGVRPSRDTVVEGAYRWHLTFGLVHHPDAPAAVHRFIEFALGPAGAKALETYDVAPPT